MDKDAFYFPHDSNAKDDPKNVLLIEQLGLEGYGIYWVLIETLRDQPGYRYPLKLIPAIARRYNTTAEKMKTVVRNYDLFEITDDEFFLSPSLTDRMLKYDEKKEKARMAAKSRWQKELPEQSGRNANAPQTQCTPNASRVNKSRVDESKGKKKGAKKTPNFTPPAIDEVKAYCKERNNNVDPGKWHDFYSSKGWMVGKNKMKDWKAAVRTWEKSENYGGNDKKTGGQRGAMAQEDYSKKTYSGSFYD